MFLRRLLFDRYLDEKENLFFTIHRHWLVIFPQMLSIGIFGYAVPLGILFFIIGFQSPLSVVFFIWLGSAFLFSLYAFLDWYLDAWLVTDISLINTSWDGFFQQSSSRIDYDSIESIDTEKKGVKQTLFNYGHIILIKSSGVNIRMESVWNPHEASQWISALQTRVLQHKSARNADAIKNLLSEVIQQHIRVNS